jgi:hypothetical protein
VRSPVSFNVVRPRRAIRSSSLSFVLRMVGKPQITVLYISAVAPIQHER